MIEEDLVQYIAENLVNDPEQVKIARKENNRSIILELSVASDDMGRVIGRNGRVANSIRALLRSLPSENENKGRNHRRKRIILEIE